MPARHHDPGPRAAGVSRVPGALPLLGHIIPLLRDHLGFLCSTVEHGDLAEIRLGPFRTVIVTDAALTRQFLLDDRTFDKGGVFYDRHRQASGNNVVVCPHSEHRRQRRMLQPAFHKSRYPAYAQVMSDQLAAFTEDWADGRVITLFPDVLRLVTYTIIKTIFAAELSARTVEEITADVAYLMDAVVRRMALPRFLNRVPTPGSRRFAAARARMQGHIRALLAAYRDDPADHGDVLSILMNAHDGGVPITDTEICDQIQIFFMAGTETTATTLSWALYMVATHPEIQDRLTAEADAVCPGRAAVWADLPRLTYTEQVVTEALRMYPAGWYVTRTVTEDSRLGDVPLRAGTMMAYSTYALHRRADLFPDPYTFDPDRWGGEARLSRQPEGLLPFGAGPRKCIGDTFAVTEMVLTVATIAARWRLTPLTDAPARPAFGTTPHPRRDLAVRVTARADVPVPAAAG